MKITKILKLLIILTIILTPLFYIEQTEAALIGVNRVDLIYNDVLRWGYAEQQIIVTIGTELNVQVFYEAKGEIADWIRFEPQNYLFVNQDNPGIINVIVEPPQDTRVDTYEGIILITTGSLGEISTQMGTNIEVAVEVEVLINITGTQIISCTAGGMTIDSIEIDEQNTLQANIRNTGNVRIRPQFELKIYSQMQETLIKEYTYRHTNEIAPTKTEQINSKINLNLEPGQYWAEINEPVCGTKNLITFSVLERGSISDEGEFIRISTHTWAKTNEIIPITATFKNTGTRTVSAQFKGIITKDNKIIQLLESNTINVEPNQETQLEMYYTPKEAGQYKVTGRVHFNNKITHERGTIINVNENNKEENETTNTLITILLTITIIIITTLLFLILKKKKKKRKQK